MSEMVQITDDVSLDKFIRFAKQLRESGMDGIILTGDEPTTARDFKSITAWMDYNNIRYGVHTHYREFVGCNPEYLMVMLDHEDIESVRRNVITFASYKKYSTKLVVQIHANSTEEAKRMCDAVSDLPVDYIVLKGKCDISGIQDGRVIDDFEWNFADRQIRK